jgi:hypothetical protein
MPTKFRPGSKQGRKKLPDKYDKSPISRFSGTEVEANLDHFHPFRSPVFVLENALQALRSHNKWIDRARVGIYMCHSPSHASSVPLILNTQTGNVSPQFHCIYDDEFKTCKRDAQFKSLWQMKAKLRSKKKSTDRFDALPTVPLPQQRVGATPVSAPIPIPPAPADPLPQFVEPWITRTVNDGTASVPVLPVPDVAEPLPPDQVEAPSLPSAPNEASEGVTMTRSGHRVRRCNPWYFSEYVAIMAFMHTFSPMPATETIVCLLQPDFEAYSEPHPFALLTENVIALIGSDPDTMHLEDALKQPDRAEFVKAMHKEVNDHIVRKHCWKVVPSKAVLKGKIPRPMVWSMKRKRNPIGDIIKWKARLCAGGHKSLSFVDYWCTYSPIVSWNTVRLMIVMALFNNWHMQSIDFVLAFPQAPIKTDIYMRPPKVPFNFDIPDLPSFTDRFINVYKLQHL